MLSMAKCSGQHRKWRVGDRESQGRETKREGNVRALRRVGKKAGMNVLRQLP